MVKPADLGAFEPLESAAAADPTFAAIVDSFGQAPALSLAPVQARPTASLGRNAAEIGNLLPLPYRNGVLGEPVATPAAALSANVPGPLPSAPGVSAPLADPFPRHSAAPVTARQPGTFVTQRSNREPSGGEWLTRPTAEEGLPESDGLRRIFGREPIPAALETDRFVTDKLVTESRQVSSQDVTQLASTAKLVPSPATGDPSTPMISLASALNVTAGPTATVASEAPFPLHHARFAEGFSQQVLLVASDGVQRARISINPPELGPVELRIVVRNEEAAIQLASPHGAVRDALEEALPRLREQFEQAGMRLGDTGVFNELPGRSPTQQDADEGSVEDAKLAELESLDPSEHPVIPVRRGFVDAYV
jgi:hypothetical protein